MADNELERIYTIPLRKVKATSRNGRADRAVRAVRGYLERHMKSDDIWIDDAVNQAIWARGKYTIPSRLRVRAVKFEDGVVEVSLPEEDRMTSIRAALKEERESKAPILPTPEGEEEEEGDEEPGSAEIEAEPEEGEGEKATGEIEAEPEEGEGDKATGEIEAEPEEGENKKPTGEIEAEPEKEPETEEESASKKGPSEKEDSTGGS